jgi:hypothetical protein
LSDAEPPGATAPLEPADFTFDSPLEELVKYAVTAPVQVGSHRVFVRAKDSSGAWGKWASADFHVSAVGVFEAWLDGFGLSGTDRAGSADPDHDGLANAIEFACNLNPTVHDPQVLTPGTGQKGLPHVSMIGTGVGGRLRVEFLRRKGAPETAYLVKFCGDLAGGDNWAPAPGPETVTSIDGTWERVAVEDTTAAGIEQSRFAGVWIRFGP